MKKKAFITYPAVVGKFDDQDALARVRKALVDEGNPGDWFAMRYEGVGGGYACEFEPEDLLTHSPSEVVFIVKPKNADVPLRQLVLEGCSWDEEDLDQFAREYEEETEASLWDMEACYLFETEAEAAEFADDYLRGTDRDALHCMES